MYICSVVHTLAPVYREASVTHTGLQTQSDLKRRLNNVSLNWEPRLFSFVFNRVSSTIDKCAHLLARMQPKSLHVWFLPGHPTQAASRRRGRFREDRKRAEKKKLGEAKLNIEATRLGVDKLSSAHSLTTRLGYERVGILEHVLGLPYLSRLFFLQSLK